MKAMPRGGVIVDSSSSEAQAGEGDAAGGVKRLKAEVSDEDSEGNAAKGVKRPKVEKEEMEDDFDVPSSWDSFSNVYVHGCPGSSDGVPAGMSASSTSGQSDSSVSPVLWDPYAQ